MSKGISREHFLELLAKAKAQVEAAKEDQSVAAAEELASAIEKTNPTTVDMSLMGIPQVTNDEEEEAAVDAIKEVISTPAAQEQTRKPGVARDVILNEKQRRFADKVLAGDNVVLIGAAGTGKTTSMRTVTRELMDSGKIKNLSNSTKWLRVGYPGAAVLSFTRKAVNNIRYAVADEIKPHTLTCHKLLEFAPVKYEIEDPENPGQFKTTMRFEPQRNADNPLPPDLKFIAWEESSMVSVILYLQYKAAMPHVYQEVFLGDIQQLPPVFGLAILGFKMLELEVVELTEVYRQALESPIISLAWTILKGNPHDFDTRTESYKTYSPILQKEVSRIRCPKLDEYSRSNEQGEVKIQIWQKTLTSDMALNTATKQFTAWADQGYYNPDDDIILCPFNKAFGTIELNKGIAQHLGMKRGATVHEVVAGYNKYYLAVGDRVLYDKEDAFIIDIARNSEYMGKPFIAPSKNLDRWGHYREAPTAEEQMVHIDDGAMTEADIDKFMELAADDINERVTAASHVVVVKLAYSDEEVEIDTAKGINDLLGGYAITVHKAQGSEWDKVFFIMHTTHAVMTQRELLYTAVTRAKKFLHIICETDTLYRGVKSQKIKGNTIKEKAEWFKGKEKDYQQQLELIKQLESREFVQTAAKKEDVHEAPVQIEKEPDKPKAELIKLEQFVPEDIKSQAYAALQMYWAKAHHIWGDKIGAPPVMHFNLQRSGMLGNASTLTGVIRLNPVWCIAAADNEAVRKEMLDITIGHEVAHIVAHRYAGDNEHNEGWVMAMRLLGLPADKIYKGDDLPPWTSAYTEIVRKVKEKLEAEKQVNMEEYY